MSVARIYRVGSPFNGSELNEVDFEQSADTMYLAHLNHAPCKLVRAGHTSWAFSDVSFTPKVTIPTSVSAVATIGNSVVSGDGYFPQTAKYVATAVDDDSGQESRPSTSSSATNDLTLKKNYNTITWSAVTGAERYRVYKANNTGDFGYIGTTTGTSFTDDNIGPDLSTGPPVGYNPFAATGDYPSTVSFFQQRLIWARTSNKPNALWGSRSGDYENLDYSRPLRASDGFSFALVAGRVNAVNQLVSMTSLLALTSDSLFKIEGGQAGYISAIDFASRRENGRGSSRLGPLVIDSVAFYQTAIGNTVRALGYEFESDSTNSNDVTIFSPHLFRDFNIVSWAYVQEPRSLVIAVRDDGKILCFTWEREQQVWGWTLWETDGAYESVCAISESGEDRIYVTVRRDGRLLIERFAATRYDTIDDACFLDSAVSYLFTTPQAVLNNLDHLEGKTVSALADGAVVQGLVVTGGKVTLPRAVTKATAGLPYTALVETLPLAVQTRAGWSIAKPQTQAEAIVRLIESRGVLAGPTDTKLDRLRNRRDEIFGATPEPKTGLYEVPLQPDINDGARMVVASTEPLPMTVTGIYIDADVSR
jgi:hypothetical protein